MCMKAYAAQKTFSTVVVLQASGPNLLTYIFAGSKPEPSNNEHR
jgi:hypothetical protein